MEIDWIPDSGGWYDALAYTEPCVLLVRRNSEYVDAASGERFGGDAWTWEAVDPNVKPGEVGYPCRWESGEEDSLGEAKAEAEKVARRWFGEYRRRKAAV